MAVKQIHVLADRSAETPWNKGFFQLRRLQLQNEYLDGSKSEAYACDVLERRGVDAVAVFLYRQEAGKTYVLFRECIRPAVYLRITRAGAIKSHPEEHYPVLVEAIAGIVEPSETDLSGVCARAAEEALEEAGVKIAPEAVTILGAGAFDAPGIMAEKVFFAAALYDPAQRGEPKTDGSPFEERGAVFELSLEEAFARIESGALCDMKTELGLRRLAAWLARNR